MTHTTVLEADLNRFDQRLSTSPFEPRLYINRGMMYFKLGRLQESLKDFNKAEELNPQLTPYLWQRGLTYYYLKKYAKAARQFELNLSIQSQALESTLWFFLCIAQLENVDSARDCLLPIRDDVRPYMQRIYQVFAGNYKPDTLTNLNSTGDRYQLFYSNFYGGLYYEAQKDLENSSFLIAKAIHYKIDQYIWYVASTHQHLRRIENAELRMENKQ